MSHNDNKDSLYKATRKGQWDKLRTLLQNENHNIIRTQIGYTRPISKRNALHAACKRKIPFDLFQIMLHHAPARAILQRDKYGNTPLHSVIEQQSSEEEERIIAKIIEACPQSAAISNQEGEKPLHLAIDLGKSSDIIQKLLIAAPSSIRSADKYGYTPLSFFFYRWNGAIRNALESSSSSVGGGEHSSIPNVVEIKDESGHVKPMNEIYDTTVTFLQIATRHAIRTPFQFLHSSILIPECPYSFVRMFLAFHPEQEHQYRGVVEDDHHFLLHTAAAMNKSSSDGELYRCWGCRLRLNDDPFWYKDLHLGIYCRNCYGISERENDCVVMRPVDKIPAIVKKLIAIHPKTASFPNEHGRLPFHIALEQGKAYQREEMKVMFRAAPEALSTMDIGTHMYPFMLASVAPKCDGLLKQLTCIFTLLMENPTLVAGGV